MSNAFKHAFVGRNSGSINVAMRRVDNERLEIIVEDDGVGLPEGAEPIDMHSMGMTLVFALAKQISGSVDFERGRGCKSQNRLSK